MIFCVIYTVSGTCKVAYKFSIVVETEVCKESKNCISMTILRVGLCRFKGLKLIYLSFDIVIRTFAIVYGQVCKLYNHYVGGMLCWSGLFSDCSQINVSLHGLKTYIRILGYKYRK